MQIENLWSGLIAFILGAVLILAFYPVLTSMIGITEPEVQLFVAIIAIIGLLIVIVSIPLGAMTQDDRGRIS